MNWKQQISSLKVKSARYMEGYKLSIDFSDGSRTIVDFKSFLDTIHDSYLKKYKKPGNFKKFNIEEGNVVWGRDWDLIFPVSQLHSGKILLAR